MEGARQTRPADSEFSRLCVNSPQTLRKLVTQTYYCSKTHRSTVAQPGSGFRLPCVSWLLVESGSSYSHRSDTVRFVGNSPSSASDRHTTVLLPPQIPFPVLYHSLFPHSRSLHLCLLFPRTTHQLNGILAQLGANESDGIDESLQRAERGCKRGGEST